jgi:hypothetical protein
MTPMIAGIVVERCRQCGRFPLRYVLHVDAGAVAVCSGRDEPEPEKRCFMLGPIVPRDMADLRRMAQAAAHGWNREMTRP